MHSTCCVAHSRITRPINDGYVIGRAERQRNENGRGDTWSGLGDNRVRGGVLKRNDDGTVCAAAGENNERNGRPVVRAAHVDRPLRNQFDWRARARSSRGPSTCIGRYCAAPFRVRDVQYTSHVVVVVVVVVRFTRTERLRNRGNLQIIVIHRTRTIHAPDG